jgi:hypothetical protein
MKSASAIIKAIAMTAAIAFWPVRPDDLVDQIDQQQRETEGDDDRVLVLHEAPAGVAGVQRPHQQPLDQPAKQCPGDGSTGQRQPRRDPELETDQHVGVRADHEEFAVGEVHDLQHAEDHRQADSHQCIEAAVDQAIGQQVERKHSGVPLMDGRRRRNDGCGPGRFTWRDGRSSTGRTSVPAPESSPFARSAASRR